MYVGFTSSEKINELPKVKKVAALSKSETRNNMSGRNSAHQINLSLPCPESPRDEMNFLLYREQNAPNCPRTICTVLTSLPPDG